MTTAFQDTAFQQTPLAFQIEMALSGYPDPADVRFGVQYGPTGTEYTGTLVATGGNLILMRRR